MAPNNILNGLNLIQDHSTTTAPSNVSLVDPSSYAHLSQLDLWTNVSFAQDEPFIANNTDGDNSDNDAKDAAALSSELGKDAAAAAIVKKKRDMLAKQKAFDRAAHFPPQSHSQSQSQSPRSDATAAVALPPYDIPTLLAMTGNNQFSSDVMSLNQLLYPNPFQSGLQFVNPFPVAAPAPAPLSTSESSSNPPPAKKARSRKSSSAVSTPIGTAPMERSVSISPSAADHDEDDGQDRPTGTAEDKRRRNTQASARFRLKKKEREAAMEIKCKDLEGKVGELERECEALRRENGWLKGLVVGVTGGTGVPMTMPTGPGLSTTPASQGTQGGKRKRDLAAASQAS